MKDKDVITIFEAYDILGERRTNGIDQNPETIESRIWEISNKYDHPFRRNWPGEDRQVNECLLNLHNRLVDYLIHR